MIASTLLLAAAAAVADEAVPRLWAEEGATLHALVDASREADRGEVLLRLGEWERASASKVDPDDAEAQAKAKAHLDEAEKALDEATRTCSRERLPQALFALGDLRRARGEARVRL